VLETSFVEKSSQECTHIPFLVFSMLFPTHPLQYGQDNEVCNLEEKCNQRMKKNFNHTIENENKDSNLQVQDLSFSYTPYEDISSSKFENEIEESPPNAQQDFSQHAHVENVSMGLQWSHLDDENSQEHWQQEELVEEINLKNNDGQDCHCMKVIMLSRHCR
jgi:hypothetical protein